jgi:hypothetical protein
MDDVKELGLKRLETDFRAGKMGYWVYSQQLPSLTDSHIGFQHSEYGEVRGQET